VIEKVLKAKYKKKIRKVIFSQQKLSLAKHLPKADFQNKITKNRKRAR